ncbi:MAG: alanine:cation symporter family protein, partial [Pseudomonas formosensis]|nr:alanine:cation symporter family protein [Halopseudomonas formosensis]
MTTIVDFLNTIFWEYILIYGLIGVGLFFTLRLGLIQFRHFGEMFRSIIGARTSDRYGISPFQALCTSLASRIGTGNIAGVAVALYLGGAGAIFWMWVVALVGMATAYSESALAQLYKVQDHKGQYRGGPAFYIAKGLKAPWAGVIFALALILSFGLVFNAVQANSIADAVESAFGVPKLWVGLVTAFFAGLVIFGGLRSIARFAEYVVPFMAGAYVLMAIYVLVVNYDQVPETLLSIFRGAFGLEEAAGGVAGSMTAAMLNGIKRGLFSNEAGMGSAPNIAATATPSPHHPASQGLVQATGVFIDTILVCTATAVMILLAGVLEPGSGVTGIQLTQQALEVHIGSAGQYFVAIAILFFAFTSIVANYSYAENALIYLGLGNDLGIGLLRCIALAMVVWGAWEAVLTVFNFADASMGLMATINLIAIVLLSGTVAKL